MFKLSDEKRKKLETDLKEIAKSGLPLMEQELAKKESVKECFEEADVYFLMMSSINLKYIEKPTYFTNLYSLAFDDLIEEKLPYLDTMDARFIVTKINKILDRIQHNIDFAESKQITDQEKIDLSKKLTEEDSNFKRSLYNYYIFNSTSDEDKIANELNRAKLIKVSEKLKKPLNDYKVELERNIKKNLSK